MKKTKTKYLYDIFYDKWIGDKSNSIWLTADPHFGDEDLKSIRDITPEEQVKRINSKVGKNDVIIFLGDIGDVSYIKQIKGYKILIKGNHDLGASNYKRDVHLNKPVDKVCQHCYQSGSYKIDMYTNSSTYVYCGECENQIATFKEIFPNGLFTDNKLFDEVYTGELIISDKIKLSHIPNPNPYILNIHGHIHPSGKIIFNSNLTYKEILNNFLLSAVNSKTTTLNICPEYLNYYPINLTTIIKSGVLKNITNIYRETIDNATRRKK